MTENNLDETISNITETNIKEELYILYLEIKGELLKRCIEIDKSQFDENVSNFNIKTLLNYLKEIIYILLNNKFKINEKENLTEENININIDNNMLNSKLSQLENETIKYQADIRNLTKKLFQYKIQKDAMELKIKTYIEIEKEYDLLKEKVKYEEGRFLNNDRKDNEILILRTENSNLKKEIIKNENNTKNYELIIKTEQQKIKDLKNQINLLNKKLLLLSIVDIPLPFFFFLEQWLTFIILLLLPLDKVLSFKLPMPFISNFEYFAFIIFFFFLIDRFPLVFLCELFDWTISSFSFLLDHRNEVLTLVILLL